ncbi:MAG: hypothetical protein Q4G16_02795 [Cruoricaptor ignavus]|nr:hypothetical protein [Cruoricaptor ignavus]
MRLSNRNKIGLYNFFNTVLVILMVLGVLLFFLERYKIDVLGVESYLLLVVPILLLAIFYIRGRQIFEYDSDGEALNFKNRNIVSFLGKTVSDEFPKYKLEKFDIVNGLFFKRLYITIDSKKSHHIVLKYDISYLTKKEVADLRHSLNKVVKNNRENTQETA